MRKEPVKIRSAMKMFSLFIRFAGMLLIAVLTQAQSCEDEMPENINSTNVVRTLSALDFTQMLEFNKGMLIDLRSAEEYDAGHIIGAVNIDIMSDDFKPIINRLERDEYYFVYCAVGYKADIAAEYMRLVGFKKVFVLKDGMKGWKSRNYPTVPEQRKPEENK